MTPLRKKILIIFLIIATIAIIAYVTSSMRGGAETTSTITSKREFTIVILRKQGSDYLPIINGFKENLDSLILGRDNAAVTYREVEVEGDGQEVYERAAKDAVETKPDLIFAVAINASIAAKNATVGTSIPVVYSVSGDPIALGLIESMQSSNNNLTGINWRAWELSGKRLELTKRMKPSVKTVIVFNKKDSIALPSMLQSVIESAKNSNIQLVMKEIDTKIELQDALDAVDPKKIDALFYSPSPFFSENRDMIIRTSLKKKLPIVFHDNRKMNNGALASYGADYYGAGAQSGRLARRILISGTLPSQIPSESVTKLFFSLNNDTAKKMNIELPEDLVRTADEIISVSLSPGQHAF